MKKQNHVFTTAVLVIFVLCHILPLHNAISDCVDSNVHKTVEDLDQLVKDRFEIVRQKERDLENKENNDLLRSILGAASIGTMTGGFLGCIGSLISLNPIPMFLGSLGGATTGTIAAIQAHYKAIDDAKEALKTAKDEYEHAKAALHLAEQAEAESTIQPQNYGMNINWLPTHDINISSSTLPIKDVSVAFMPLDATDTRPPIYAGDSFSTNIWSTTVSYTFSRYQKGIYNAQVTVTLIDGRTIYRQYNISVTDE